MWDLKAKKAIITFSDSAKFRNSALSWHPNVPTQLATVSEEDRKPVVQLWDLRNARAPVRELAGHQAGILGLSWSPFDHSLIATGGKDCRTVCWNIDTGEQLQELPRRSNWVFDVHWSPRVPALLLSASFDSRITISGLHDTQQRNLHDPESSTSAFLGPEASGSNAQPPVAQTVPGWLKRPSGVSWGFGGHLVTFSSPASPAAGQPLPPPQVVIETFTADSDLTKSVNDLLAAHTAEEYKLYLEKKLSDTSLPPNVRSSWEVLQLLFSDSRAPLLSYIGLDKERIAQAAAAACTSSPAPLSSVAESSTPASPKQNGSAAKLPSTGSPAPVADHQPDAIDGLFGSVSSTGGSGLDMPSLEPKSSEEDIFSQVAASALANEHVDVSKPSKAPVPHSSLPVHRSGPIRLAQVDLLSHSSSPGANKLDSLDTLSSCLLTGQIEMAARLCASRGQWADALILASHEGPTLWKEIQDLYLTSRAPSSQNASMFPDPFHS